MNSTKSANWRERFDVLNAQLELEPQHPSAWRWRLEAKVLRFVLRRYGEQAPIAPLQTQSETWISPLAIIAQPEREPLPRERNRALRHIARAGEEARATAPDAAELIFEEFENRTRHIRERDARQRERERQFVARMRERAFRKR